MRTLKNAAPIKTVDQTGSAHSSDGRYTRQQTMERPGGLLPSPGSAPLPVTVEQTDDGLRVTLENPDALEAALPADWLPSERERWAQDNRLRYRMWLYSRYGTPFERFEPPAVQITGNLDSEAELLEQIEETPAAAYARGAQAGDFQRFVEETGTQGYGDSAFSGRDPSNTPYQVVGDIGEASGHQRATVLAIHQGAPEAHNFSMSLDTPWDDAHVSYFDERRLEVRLTVNQAGELVRLEREPEDSDRHPWKAPQNLTDTPEFEDYRERIRAAALAGS